MKFIIDKNKFLNLLKLPTNIVDNSNINPVLAGILIECKEKELIIISSNNNLSIHTSCNELEIISTGRVLIRGKLLFSIVNKLKQSQITFEVVDNSIVRISANNFSSDINLLDDVGYPSINFNFSNWTKININSKFLKEVTYKVANTTNLLLDRSTPLNGILFDSTRLEGFLECVGTDGHHLSYLKTPFAGEKFKIIISVENLKNIAELITNDQDIIFHLLNRQLIVKVQQTLFNCRLIEGDYPSAIKAIEAPQQFQFTVNKVELIDAIERGIVLAGAEKKPSILCNISENTMKISCRSIEYGSSYEEIAIKNYSGNNLSVSFNVKYLMDLLKNIDNSEVLFQFTENTKPFFVKDSKNDNYTSLVLPIRII